MGLQKPFPAVGTDTQGNNYPNAYYAIYDWHPYVAEKVVEVNIRGYRDRPTKLAGKGHVDTQTYRLRDWTETVSDPIAGNIVVQHPDFTTFYDAVLGKTPGVNGPSALYKQIKLQAEFVSASDVLES